MPYTVIALGMNDFRWLPVDISLTHVVISYDS